MKKMSRCLFPLFWLCTLLVGGMHTPCRGQTTDTISFNKRFYGIGTVAIGIPTGDLRKVAQTGIYASSGFEYRLTRHWFVGAIFDFWNTRVTLPPRPPETYVLKSSSNNAVISGFVGYRVWAGRWAAYAYGGVGGSLITSPVLQIDEDAAGTRRYESTSRSQIYPNLKAGLGIEYNFSPTIIPYIEASFVPVLGNTVLNNSGFAFATVGVGGKAYFDVRLKKKRKQP